MARIGAFVAEVSVDFDDFVDAPHHRPLEVELGGDAQVKILVVGVDVGDERAGGRASVDGLEHGRLKLEVAAIVEVGAQRLHDARAKAHHVAGRRAHDEVEVAHAHARLLGKGDVFAVGVRVHLRQGADGLGGNLPGAGEYGELAALGRSDVPFHEKVVAEVDVGLESGEGLLADVGQRQKHLDAVSGAVLKGREGDFSGRARKHDASGDPHGDVGQFDAGFEAAVFLSQLGNRRCDGKLDRIRFDAFVDHLLAFGEPNADLAGKVVVLRRRGGRLVGSHGQ